MSEISLYRKYRPQNFQNLVGQDHIRTTLLNALKAGHPAHAYLFCGPRGTGKTSTARLLAKALNCLEPSEEGEPCDKCEMCENIREVTLIDLIEIDAASNRGIDEIRDLKDKINFAPTRAKHKVYIIDEVHMLTKEAFNALLKTLEEPPDHVFFILATTESHKVPETIISRCQRFDFKRITKKAISARLMYIAQLEGYTVEEEAISAIAHSAEGGLRDAIGLLEQLTTENKLTFDRVKEVLGISGQSALEGLYNYLRSGNSKAALSNIQSIYAEGIDLVQFTKDFLEHLRIKMIEATEQDNNAEIHKILEIITNFQKAYDKIRTSTIPQLPLEMAVIETTMDMPEPTEIPVQAAKVPEEKKIQPEPEVLKEIVTEKPTKAPPAPEAPKAPEQQREHAGVKQNISEQERETPEEKIPLTIAYVKENWPRVTELIKTPLVRLTLKNGKPTEVNENIVTIEFTSNFHKDQLDKSEIKLEIEEAFNKVFEGNAKIEFKVGKVELSPQKEEEPEVEVEHKKEETAPKSTAAAALEMFGGELIED